MTAPTRVSSGAFTFHVEPVGSRTFAIEASTNLIDWVVLADHLSGPIDYSDQGAAQLPQRFYRVANPASSFQPTLRMGELSSGTGLGLQIEYAAGPCVIEASSNLRDWTPVATNLNAGAFEWTDPEVAQFPSRFYRARAGVTAVPAPRPTVVSSTADGGSVVEIANTPAAYVLQSSTDLIHWTSIFTNFSPAQIQLVATSQKGDFRHSNDVRPRQPWDISELAGAGSAASFYLWQHECGRMD